MTLGAYFAAAAEHQQLAWLGGSTLEVLVDSAVSNGQVLIMRSNTTQGSGVQTGTHRTGSYACSRSCNRPERKPRRFVLCALRVPAFRCGDSP